VFSPPAWVGSVRADLLPALRRRGVPVDARTWLTVEVWLHTAWSRGDLVHPSSARGALRAIVAKTAGEQQVFDLEFDKWTRSLETTGPRAAESAQRESPASPTAPLEGRRESAPTVPLPATTWRSRASALLPLFLLFVIAAMLPDPPRHVEPAAVDSPGQSPVPKEPKPGEDTAPLDLSRITPPAGVQVVELPDGRRFPSDVVPSGLFGIQPELYALVVLLLGLPAYFVGRVQRAQKKQIARISTREPLREQEVFARQFLPISGQRRLAIRKAARRMRSPIHTGHSTLHIERSIAATVKQAGVFKAIRSPRTMTPEFLCLIDRASYADQQFHRASDLARDLAAEGVVISMYQFDRDPRRLTAMRRSRTYHPEATGAALPLSELASRHRGQGLLLFMDARDLLDMRSGQPYAWVRAAFDPWPRKVLLTPLPVESWGAAEFALAGEYVGPGDTSFMILPATAPGLEAAAEWFSGRPTSVMSALPGSPCRLPSALRDDSELWLSPVSPSASEVKRLVEELEDYLGPAAFAWLAAVSAYPHCSADLTAYFADKLADVYTLPDADSATGSGSAALLLEARLLAIAHLPWNRRGYMPDWLRKVLFLRLPGDLRRRVRDLLGELFKSAARHGTGAPLSLGWIATGGDKPVSWWQRMQTRLGLKNIAESEPLGSPLRDVIYLGVLRGDFDDALALDAPEEFERVLNAQEESRLTWNPLRWATAGILVIAYPLVWLIRKARPVNAPQPEVEHDANPQLVSSSPQSSEREAVSAERSPDADTADDTATRDTSALESHSRASPSADGQSQSPLIYLSAPMTLALGLGARLEDALGFDHKAIYSLRPEQSGKDDPDRLLRAIASSKLFAAILQDALSPWQRAEIKIALEIEKPVALVLVGEAERPDLPASANVATIRVSEAASEVAMRQIAALINRSLWQQIDLRSVAPDSSRG
jgi:hypothetical protein